MHTTTAFCAHPKNEGTSPQAVSQVFEKPFIGPLPLIVSSFYLELGGFDLLLQHQRCSCLKIPEYGKTRVL